MTSFSNWSKRLSALPRWALGLIALAGIVIIFILALLGTALDSSPAVGAGSNPASTLLTVLGIFWKLGLVILIAYVSLYLLRRMQSTGVSRARKQLTILESHHLSPRQTVHLVQVGDQVFLIGATDQSISMLSEVSLAISEQSETKVSSPVSLPFAETLAETARQLQGKLS